ncbi:MAG TPA: TIGR00282 family metallophosphoesterase, partial [Gaiellaceae bacterium]|nr:TIGR00282 family metallophosphoesterase [Gaiellaceae bacterium]
MRILFIADVVGAPGRRALEQRLRAIRDEHEIDACVVNGENAADGIGITPRLADQILGMGVDAITLGNHAFRRTEIGPYLESSDRVIRPANTSRSTPGRGLVVVPAANGARLAVINVLGSLFLHPATSMFEVIDELVEEARSQTPVVLVDVHAEATSEKAALARWLDGRVTAVVGTHTHVQTSDATVLPKGTAFI